VRLATRSAHVSSSPTNGGGSTAVIAAVVLAWPVVSPPGGTVEHRPPGNAGVHVGEGDALLLGFGDGLVLGLGDGQAVKGPQLGFGLGLPPVQGWPKWKPGLHVTGLQFLNWPGLQVGSFLAIALAWIHVWNGKPLTVGKIWSTCW